MTSNISQTIIAYHAAQINIGHRQIKPESKQLSDNHVEGSVGNSNRKLK
jgi:hypothetical protein